MDIKLRTACGALTATSLAFFGIAFHKAWVYSCLPLLRDFSVGEIPLRVIFEILCALAAFTFAFLAKYREDTSLHKSLVPLAVGCQIAASALLAIGTAFETTAPIVVPIASLFGAIGTIAMALLWTDVYASLNPLRVALFYSGGIVVASFIVFATQDGSPLRIASVSAMLPVITLACLKRAESVAERERGSGPDSLPANARFLPWKVILFISAYAFAYGISIRALAPGSGAPTFTTALPAAIVFASVLFNTKGFNFESIYRVAFPLMVLGFLAAAAVPGIDRELSAALASVSYISVEMLVVLVVCGFSYRTGMSAFWLFGIVKGCQYLSKFLGLAAMNAISSLEAAREISVIAFVLVIILVIAASLLFATERSLFSDWGSNLKSLLNDPEHRTSTEKPTQAMLFERIKGLSEFYRLTQRETEVLMLLARGKSVRGIGADMFIAEGTVKAHIQHIYQKLDVHNRQELLAVIGTPSSIEEGNRQY